ncbi:LVIVD repeat-containing protein [Thermoactinospora rubra]|uniref:LVIVD repeat-containing protein n=1 Tax=Thermoactinospora rubra TaxID=1088767 RepID=UPI000A10DD48|nr:hypothetical protein [Thermoactinospora rubra]
MSLRGLSARVLLATGVVLTMVSAPAGAAPDDYVKSNNIRLEAHLDLAPAATINSDIAFQGDYAYVGNFNGFAVYDIKHPKRPRLVSSVLCPGGQMDVTILGDILVTSVDESRSDDSCASKPQSAREPSSWEGLRIFDVSDKANPRYVKSVETDCGSHTHTLVPDKQGEAFYVYVSSYAPSDSFPDCRPPHDKISIVKVPLDDPAAAAVVATPVLFPPDQQNAAATTGCHDITAYPALDLAAGACMGDGVLLDISDREQPRVIDRVTDANFAFWHSATFNNAGTKVVFTDELGGGTRARCTAAEGPTRGADAVYDIVDRRLVFRSYYKISRLQTATENCVAHNGSLIPVKGRDIMVQAWYQGGVSVWDFTDSANPREIAFFDRAPISDTQLVLGGYWSAYYYNGYVYGSEIYRGFDVFRVVDPRVNQAGSVKLDLLNVQTQGAYPERGNGVPGGS